MTPIGWEGRWYKYFTISRAILPKPSHCDKAVGLRSFCQPCSQEFASGGLFWRLETTSNDLDPDFDRSLIRLSQWWPPKKVFTKIETVFLSKVNPVFLVQITSGPTPILIAHTFGGAIFVFEAKISLKSAKNRVFCILFRPMGGAIALPGYATAFCRSQLTWLAPAIHWVKLLYLTHLPSKTFALFFNYWLKPSSFSKILRKCRTHTTASDLLFFDMFAP